MQVTPFLMFEGSAQAAMDFYASLFPDARMESIARYGEEGPGPAGTVMLAVFRWPASASCARTAS